ncbi:MAG: alpha-1,2-fucosyltransferase [Syntrophomonas sp.]
MIIVRLKGGLGNQLFQYALGRKIALIHNTVLKFDISFYEQEGIRSYDLTHFNIIENIATQNEINRIRGKICLHKDRYNCPVVEEPFFPYNPRIIQVPNNVYLDGYWQSEKYFLDIEDILRREFTVKYPLKGLNQSLADTIKNCNSVALHIRRGDYVTNPENFVIFGVCSWEYYKNCIEQLTAQVTSPHFFIFSDDPQWVLNNIHLPYPTTFVVHNQDKNYEDLRLMSMCRHNIIANSSFSWWGAWLNTNPNKMVFAPARWFVTTSLDTRDVIPLTWHKCN